MSKERTNRPKRVPLGTRNVLTAPKKEGYYRRFVNDKDGRIQDFEAAGYTVVKGETQVGDPKAGDETQIGSTVNKAVGSGTRAVLMEIPIEYYNEDQEAKQTRIRKTEDGMRRNKNQNRAGEYGEVTIG